MATQRDDALGDSNMPPHILLTGAGFSHNWGGYLTKEAFDYLLGVTEHDEDLRRVLWADQAKGWGFETTLARLRKEYEENYSPQVEQDFNNMTTAVRRMFGDMWLAFSQATFDNQFDNKRLGVIRFLTRFDAIFTLNQDTLLETHYLPVVTSTDFAKNTYQGPRNVGAYRPGLVQALDQRSRACHEAAVLACTATEVGLASRQNAAVKLGRQIARRIDLPQTAAAGGRMPSQRESLARFTIHPAPTPIGNVRLASSLYSALCEPGHRSTGQPDLPHRRGAQPA
jgi:hypothetical protein